MAKKKTKKDYSVSLDRFPDYASEGCGTVIYVFNKKIDYDLIEEYTNEVFPNGYSEYDPSTYYSKIAGELSDEVTYDDLISSIKSGKTPKAKLMKFFKEIIDDRYDYVIVIGNDENLPKDEDDDEESEYIYISDLLLNEAEKRIDVYGKDLILYIRTYDEP